MTGELLSLAAAAESLGVHYMTAYRYVRTGRLPATKRDGQWWISAADLAQVTAPKALPQRAAADGDETASQPTFIARAPRLLRSRAIAGDEAGAWSIISEALAYGGSPDDIHLKIIGPMMYELGVDWRSGLITIAEEHQASVVVGRLIARLGPQFSPRGRRRASVVLGAVEGEHHGLPIMMLADLLSGRGFAVTNLGPNTPVEAFLDTCGAIDGEVAIGVSAIAEPSRDTLNATVGALRAELPNVPIFIGGRVGCELAEGLDVAGSADTGAGAIALFEEHFPRSGGATSPLTLP